MPNRKKKKAGQSKSKAEQQRDAAARRHAPSPGGRGTAGPKANAPRPEDAKLPETPATHEDRGSGTPSSQHYVDISVVRIQQWLARTTDLKFRRGASVLLTEATAPNEWTTLPPGATWNDQAGEVDGVVSLKIDDEVTTAADVARHVADVIKERMPQAQVQAVHGTGPDYATAYEDMERARQSGDLLIDSPPVVPELITAKPCDKCRTAPALRQHEKTEIIGNRRDPEYADLCGECAGRHRASKGTKGNHRPPRPEQRMRDALQKEHGIEVRGFPDDFSQMALAGQTSRDATSSQLALIYADGNRVGAFLHEALQQRKIDKRDIVRVISEATVGALADAVADRYRGWERPPVLANLAGGDDLLVSVPAPDAWLFTVTLMRAFAKRVGTESGGWPEAVRRKRPSLSAGLVFHHQKHPFADLVRLADERLSEAKRALSGEGAAVSFLDVTADGGQPPPDREPVSLDYLRKHAPHLARLEKTRESRRQTLLAYLRRRPSEDVIRKMTDLDNQPVWDVLVEPGATADDVRKKLAADPGFVQETRLLLDIARHYRADPRTEPRPGTRREGNRR